MHQDFKKHYYLKSVCIVSTGSSPLDLRFAGILCHPHHTDKQRNKAMKSSQMVIYMISVGSPVSAKCACRGSFQFRNVTSPLTAARVGVLNPTNRKEG